MNISLNWSLNNIEALFAFNELEILFLGLENCKSCQEDLNDNCCLPLKETMLAVLALLK